jgi:hypothetical protein
MSFDFKNAFDYYFLPNIKPYRRFPLNNYYSTKKLLKLMRDFNEIQHLSLNLYGCYLKEPGAAVLI